jgi:hypothetical protein
MNIDIKTKLDSSFQELDDSLCLLICDTICMYAISADLGACNIIEFQIQDIRPVWECVGGLWFVQVLSEYLWGPDN